MGTSIASKILFNLSKKQLLERSSEFIFSTGLNDGAANLSKENMKFGIAQFQLILEKYGFEPKVTFVSCPDETISRNTFRWNSGLGYGGRLNWGSGYDRIIFLNVKPNYCGILCGGLNKRPDPHEIIKNIDEIKSKALYHDNILINWDYDISNHFINCFETHNLSDMNFPPYMFFIHGSAPEFRDERYGLGLYIDKSKALKELAIKEETKFGIQYILLDKDAKDYLDFNMKAFKFSQVKREIIARQVFGNDVENICNQPHQFLMDFNNMYLGSNCTEINNKLITSNIFPTALRADISCYLFKGKKNLSHTVLRNLNFLKRAERLEVRDLLENINILPHGGGYAFPDITRIQKVIEYKDQRYFVCNLKSNVERKEIIRNVNEIQFSYRGRSVILKTLQLDLGEIIARLNPIFSLKL